MDRLARRILILRGRRTAEQAPATYTREACVRARAARRLRALVAQDRVVVLQHPRWAEPREFLESVAVELQLGSPPARAEVVDLTKMRLRRPSEAWSRLLAAVAELAAAPLGSAAAWPVARAGFRFGLRDLLDRVEPAGPIKVLVLVGAQRLPLEVVEDLGAVWAGWAAGFDGASPLRLVLSMEGDQAAAIVPDAAIVELPDFSPIEALHYLVARVGPEDAEQLAAVVSQVGGLPAALRGVAELGGLAGASGMAAARLALGDEFAAMHEAKTIVCADERLAERVEALERAPATFDAQLDVPLRRAGLVQVSGPRGSQRTALRSPLVARVDQAAG